MRVQREEVSQISVENLDTEWFDQRPHRVRKRGGNASRTDPFDASVSVVALANEKEGRSA